MVNEKALTPPLAFDPGARNRTGVHPLPSCGIDESGLHSTATSVSFAGNVPLTADTCTDWLFFKPVLGLTLSGLVAGAAFGTTACAVAVDVAPGAVVVCRLCSATRALASLASTAVRSACFLVSAD